MQQEYPWRVWPSARRVCPLCHQDVPALPYNRLGSHGPWGGQPVCPASGATFAWACGLRDSLSEAAILAAPRSATGTARLTRAEQERVLARRLEQYFQAPHRSRAAIIQALRLAQTALGHPPIGNRELAKLGTTAARIYNTELQPGMVLAPRFFREFYVARDVDPRDGQPA